MKDSHLLAGMCGNAALRCDSRLSSRQGRIRRRSPRTRRQACEEGQKRVEGRASGRAVNPLAESCLSWMGCLKIGGKGNAPCTSKSLASMKRVEKLLKAEERGALAKTQPLVAARQVVLSRTAAYQNREINAWSLHTPPSTYQTFRTRTRDAIMQDAADAVCRSLWGSAGTLIPKADMRGSTQRCGAF